MARGSITTRELKNGEKRYYVALWIEIPGGKRKQIWRTFHRKRDADAFLDAKSKEVRDGEYVHPSKITFEEFGKEWLEKYPKLASSPMKPSTLQGYHSLIKAHLIPFFGPMRISQIRSSTIDNDFRSQLPSHLSGKSVRNILMVLRRMLESAVEWDYIPANPFHARKRVRLPALSKDQKGRALSPEEVKRLLDACMDDTYVILATAVFTGMRRAEVFGLPWEYVDFEKNQICVKQTLFWKNGKYWNQDERGYVFVTPKSKASVRKIDMGPHLRRILLEHRMRQGNPQSGLVFVNNEGGPIDPKNFAKRQFLCAVRAAGLGKVRFHDLRHTFGSLKLEQGANIKYVQIQTGHSDVRITLNVYSHLLKETNPEAAAKTEELVFGATAPSC